MVIDKLCYRSGLRYRSAGVKFAYTIITMLICVISRSLTVAVIVLTVNGTLTVRKGGIPFRLYRRFMRIPLAFLLLGTVTMIVNISRTPLDAYAIPIGAWYLTGSTRSVVSAVQLIFSALASVSCLYFLSLNTPVPDILMILEKLHCPEILTELMLLIYRFIFILLETASEIQTSQKCRLGYKNFKTSLYSYGQMAAALLVRALKRSNALYDAMEARGYDGKIRVLEESCPPKRKEVACVIVFELILLGITVWGKCL